MKTTKPTESFLIKMISTFCAVILACNINVPCINAESLNTASKIGVSAKSAILIEAYTGKVLYSKDENTARPMASTTKIMTALVAIENCEMTRIVSISDKAVGIEGSSIYLYKGEKLTMEQLLYALMLQSANDAAAAIALEVSGGIDGFAELMNKKSKELGLKNTSFKNPHGLDCDGHYTTAHDLALITRHALNNDSFKEIVSTQKKTIPMQNGDGTRLLINHNRLLRSYDGMIGVKTGFTKKSGRCLVTAAERNGIRLIAVTLNASDDWNDHKSMLDYGFSQLESVNLISAPIKGMAYTVGAESETIEYSSIDSLSVILDKDVHNIRSVTEMSRFYYAPVEKGEVLGRIVFYDGDKEIAESPIIATEGAEKKRYKKSFIEWLKSIFLD